jgi:hypothetical protein
MSLMGEEMEHGICGSNAGAYEDYHPLGCDAM